MIIDLRTTNLRDQAVGTVVITSKGFEFEYLGKDTRNKELWLDKTSGLKWFDDEEGMFNHYEAVERFNSPEKRLPTKEEFEDAEKHGFREVVPEIEGFRWSASVHTSVSYFAYVLYSYGGYVGYVYRGNNSGRCRCVGR